MKNSKNICFGAVLLFGAAVVAGCSRQAKLSVEIADAPESEIVLMQQNVNRYDVLDTVKTDAAGKFTYKVKLEKGDPDFVYLYRNGRKISSLLLSCGDRVSVVADTVGNYSVSGSEESEKLRQVDSDYTAFSEAMDSLAAEVNAAGNDGKAAAELGTKMTKMYTDYYRKCVRYVMENSKSLTVIPVFYQTVSNSFYVFSQDTDALHFKNVADSLAAVYPDSKYVRALKQEAESRSKQLELRVRMQTAEPVGFLDMEMPDTQGKKVRLGELDAKAILLYFWSPDDALQKMFNLDVMKKVYADYKDRGLEIYQVAVASDKPAWARVVSAQGLEWINVCDGLGQNSPAVRLYNITKLPSYFLIVDGSLSDKTITDEASLRKALNSVL